MNRRKLNRKLFLDGKRHCKKCDVIKPLEEFNLEKRNLSGRSGSCKSCEKLRILNIYTNNKERYLELSRKRYAKNLDKERTRSANYRSLNRDRINQRGRLYKKAKGRTTHNACEASRRAAKLKATPKWADIQAIKSIYDKCPKGFHVDHVIPLKGKTVCGLHVEYNLQYLRAIDNIKKSNKIVQDGG